LFIKSNISNESFITLYHNDIIIVTISIEWSGKLKKKLKIILPIIIVIVMATILMVPGAIGSQDGSIYVTRMYGDTMEGPWSNTSSETSKYVLEISTFGGQTTIVINEITFLWESPEDTLVFKGKKGGNGDIGPEGLQGPQGPRGSAGGCGC
jgi:hypothetical protein